MSNASSDFNKCLSPFYYLHEPFAAEVARLTVDILIALSGVLGNILVCLVVTRKFRKNTPINYYILSLAVADLGVLLVNFPFAIMKAEVPSHWPLGKAVCLYIYPTVEVFFGASIWSITAIAVERYRNIVCMKGVSQRQSLVKRSIGKSVYFVLVAVWLGSLLTTVPVIFHFKYISESKSCFLLWPSQTYEQVYNTITVFFSYILPLNVITWTYIHIGRSLRQSTAFNKEMSGQQSSGNSRNSRMKQNSKAKRILTPLVIVFAVTMLPIHTMKLGIAFWRCEIISNEGFLVMFNLCMTLTIMNSACNAFIYSLVSKEFRAGFKALLLSWKIKWHNRSSMISTESKAFTDFVSHRHAMKSKNSGKEYHWPLPQEYNSLQETNVWIQSNV